MIEERLEARACLLARGEIGSCLLRCRGIKLKL